LACSCRIFCRGLRLGVVLTIDTSYYRGLTSIGHQYRRTREARHVTRFRIDNHWDVPRSRDFKHAADDLGIEDSLRVIGQNNRRYTVCSFEKPAANRLDVARAQLKLPLDVETHDLLASRDVADLRSRRVAGHADETTLDPILYDQSVSD
jgi:hypothetical protein